MGGIESCPREIGHDEPQSPELATPRGRCTQTACHWNGFDFYDCGRSWYLQRDKLVVELFLDRDPVAQQQRPRIKAIEFGDNDALLPCF